MAQHLVEVAPTTAADMQQWYVAFLNTISDLVKYVLSEHAPLVLTWLINGLILLFQPIT